MRQMTTRGYDFLENEEGERLWAYDDHTGKRINAGDPVVGVLTIGVGHTGPDVFPGMTITNEESRRLFDKDTDWAEAVVDRHMVGPNGEKPNDNQFNAAVSLAFNIGQGAFPASMVCKHWQRGQFEASGQVFKNWNRDKFGVNAVLVGRRAREISMFFEPMPNELPRPMPQVVEAPKSAMQSKTVIAGGVSVAAGVATVADQINQVAPAVESIATVGYSLQGILRMGALGLSIIALVAVGYMLWRYIQKRRAGDVVST